MGGWLDMYARVHLRVRHDARACGLVAQPTPPGPIQPTRLPTQIRRRAKWDEGLKAELSIEFGKCGCSAAFGLSPSWGLLLALLLSWWGSRLLGLQD